MRAFNLPILKPHSSGVMTDYRLPTSDNTTIANQYTNIAGGNKYAAVDDPIGSPDEDSTYIYRTSNGAQAFNFTAFSITATTINKVFVVVRARTTGVCNVQARITVNGITYIPTAQNITTSYADYTFEWANSPNTGMAWTQTEVNTLLTSFQVRITSISSGEQRVTQAYLGVEYL